MTNFVPYEITDRLGKNYIFGKPGQYQQGEVITCADGWQQTIIKELTPEEWNSRS